MIKSIYTYIAFQLILKCSSMINAITIPMQKTENETNAYNATCWTFFSFASLSMTIMQSSVIASDTNAGIYNKKLLPVIW